MAGQNHEVRIKMTFEDYEKIKSKADKLGIPITTFLKQLGLRSTLTIEVE